ncbi:MAG: inositol monophosphatase [Anaerolineae bacterium]|nr:inositol monophosphatase [Anaerolineae bacterium]
MKSPTLPDLESLARRAGEILRAGYGQLHNIDHKGVIDLVTEIDQKAEAFLLNEISLNFPGHHLIAEESGGVTGDAAQIWYIDPLDGTVNYAHNIPIFSISLAFAQDGHTKLGVVYEPMRDECFSAEHGRGAWLNGKPISVSATAQLADSLLVTGFPYDTWENPINNLDNFAKFAVCTRGVRRLGSAALDLCYVAAGRFDGYWEVRLEAWDVAAGALIVREAGGMVTNLQGGPDVISPPQSVLAANPTLHPLMMAVLEGK